MTSVAAERITILVDGEHSVSGLLLLPARPQALYLLAHGAGAGMRHPFMQAVASKLAERGIATLRYQFPYMERAAKRPDSPAVAQATVRAAAAEARRLAPTLPLIAGGRSYGGRMTSQAQASASLPAVRGLVFLGFPLHPANRPSQERARHLFDVRLPMLFLQGARDALAQPSLLSAVVQRLGEHASLHLFADADHSFHLPARSGRKDADLRKEMLDVLARWTLGVIASTARTAG
jgi:predicted alpha/beta-hydrolase family hydrolase